MKLYSVLFKPLGPLTKIPDSQSLFGVFCHYYKYLFNEENLELFLKDQIEKPSFIISSLFVKDFLPMPIGMQFGRIQDEIEGLPILLKKCKQVKYISKNIYKDYLLSPQVFLNSFYKQIIDGKYVLTEDNNFLQKQGENLLPAEPFKKEMRIRNMKEESEKQLFYNYIINSHPDLVYEAYVKIVDSDKIENIKKTFEAMRYVSIGGNKSIGYNLFDCIDFKSVNDIPENQGPKLLLSKAIGDDSVNLKESNYQLKVLHNKLNNIKPTKHRQTVLAFVEGSMIHTNKEYIGKLISDSINQKLIYQNMLGLLI